MGRKRVSLKGKGADLFFGDYTPPSDGVDAANETSANNNQSASESTNESIIPSTDESVDQSTEEHTIQSTRRPTNKSSGRSPNRSTASVSTKIVDRPKAFYITERLDRHLDDAVRYLQQAHGIKKVDRSVLVNAILDNEAQWSDESLDLLVDRVVGQLTSRLTGR